MTYAIHRYPVHLIDVVRLADGSRVTIRPTLPQDAELQQEFFRGLSVEGRYRRFMTRLNELPEALVERFATRCGGNLATPWARQSNGHPQRPRPPFRPHRHRGRQRDRGGLPNGKRTVMAWPAPIRCQFSVSRRRVIC
jgi:hypothetical protein